ncbi:MAG: glycosyltransferase family 2 protein [Chloroflexaceae bacterium]|jgi:dolichyl-phosphate beta-glucosyltransferase|nr:glycosyltransferase family 2 protein [Chloroflexaceae bacterium]
MAYANYEQWKNIPLSVDPHLSVVIPAYNEAARIVPTIGAIASYLCDMGQPWELLVADDGSTDTTLALVEGLGLANLRLLRAERNGGKGSAVRRGMLAARGRYLLFADADNSTPIEELPRLLACLQSGNYKIAVGSRSAAGASATNRSPLRRTLSGGLRWLTNHGLGLGVSDTQCGFKLFSRDAARTLFPMQTLMGFSFDLELLYLARRMGYRVAEVPVAWVDAPGSKVAPLRDASRFLGDMATILLNDWRGVYARRHSSYQPQEADACESPL